MLKDPAELLRDALRLPSEARAALIDSLIDSLDSQVDEDCEAEWRLEIDNRLKRLEDGTVKLISWTDAQQRLRARL